MAKRKAISPLAERMQGIGISIHYGQMVAHQNPELFGSIEKHLEGMHDQSSHGRRGAIPAGYGNWNSHVAKLLEDSEQIDSVRGNAVQATFLEAAGFNGKPAIVSQAEFDAMEGEAMYRGVTSQAFIEDYKNSLVQYAGEGSFGNGTYATNKKESTIYYTGAESKSEIESLTMEMKLRSDANIKTFENPYDLKDWRQDLGDKFLAQYKASGKNPAEVLDVQWQLHNDGDWTNIAIMNGIDAIRFRPNPEQPEYYTIILNRGKVVINGKS